jgi:hypothetical protein
MRANATAKADIGQSQCSLAADPGARFGSRHVTRVAIGFDVTRWAFRLWLSRLRAPGQGDKEHHDRHSDDGEHDIGEGDSPLHGR